MRDATKYLITYVSALLLVTGCEHDAANPSGRTSNRSVGTPLRSGASPEGNVGAGNTGASNTGGPDGGGAATGRPREPEGTGGSGFGGRGGCSGPSSGR